MPAVLLTAGIAILSLTESTHMPAVSVSDKLMHGVMYLLLLQYACTLTRSGEWIDLLADFLGALIGVLLMILFQRLHDKMRKCENV